MGFFNLDDYQKSNQSREGLKGYSLDMVAKQGCKVCPLNSQTGLVTPQMDAMGSKKPVIYMLGEQPSKTDDHRGKHFAGKAGKLLRERVPSGWIANMRWNYIVRTHDKNSDEPPPDRKKNKKAKRKYKGLPTIAIEACRPSVVADIEKTKPFAIFGFGSGPLKWAIDDTNIFKWAGRHMPVTIGSHTCWYFAMLDPQEVLDKRKFEPRRASDYGCDEEHQFAINMKRALELCDTLPEAKVDTEEFARSKVEFVTGHKPGDLDKVLDYLDRCYAADEFGMDYETSKLRPYEKGAKILTVGLSVDAGAFAFPLDHPKAGWSKADKKELEQELYLFLKNAKGRRLIANAAFEAEWTAYHWGKAVVVNNKWECTQSQGYILDERPFTNGLDFLCQQHFGIRMKELHKVDRTNMLAVDFETCLKYNAVDAKYHRRLYLRQRRILKDEKLSHVYAEHMGRVTASAMTTIKGVPIDSVEVERLFKQLTGEVKKLENKLLDMKCVSDWARNRNEKFNVSNNNHILGVFEWLNIKVEKTEDKEWAKVDHPFAEGVRAWRKPAKLLSTYILPVRKGSEHLFPDGYLHPLIVTTKTRTWRTSSEDPNVQNWPRRGDKVYIRKLVKPIGGTEKVIVAIDYGGMQARNVAMESLDPELVRIYNTGYDIHTDWWKRLDRIVPNWEPVEALGDDTMNDPKKRAKGFRDTIKNKFVFPCFFGAHETALARYLGIKENKAADLRGEFFDKFRTLEKYQESQREFYKKHGYVTGHTGFRRRAPIEINQLINAPIQADESFIVCKAWRSLVQYEHPDFTPVWMIHDDLTFIWEKRDVDKRLEIVIPEMVKHRVDWTRVVPLEIDVSLGATWNDLKKASVWKTSKDNGFEQVKD